MFGNENSMSPDDHYQDLKRIISAATGKAKLRGTDRIFDIILTILVGIVMLVVLYPIVYVISSSFSSSPTGIIAKYLLSFLSH